MSISAMSLRLPGLLQEQLIAARDAGCYASEAELVADAVRMLLAARPDVRWATACRLYERGIVSLGRAAELAGLDVVNMKRILHERGIVRIAPESLTETTAMARVSLQVAGRSV